MITDNSILSLRLLHNIVDIPPWVEQDIKGLFIMQITIKAHDFTLTKALKEHTKNRVHAHLSRYGERIQQVSVRLDDINGPRGGADKRCQIQIVIAGLPSVNVEDIEADMYIAITRAVDRASRAVKRKINRYRDLKIDGSRIPVINEDLS